MVQTTRFDVPGFGGKLIHPGDAGYEQRLGELLFPRSLGQEVLDALRPLLDNRALLTPSGYEQMVYDAREELEAAARDARWSEEEKEALRGAAALLGEEQSLRELLSTYRHLLHRA